MKGGGAGGANPISQFKFGKNPSPNFRASICRMKHLMVSLKMKHEITRERRQ